MESSKLLIILLIPLAGILIQLLIPKIHTTAIKVVCILTSVITLAYSVFLAISFDIKSSIYQFKYYLSWLPDWGININLALDGINSIAIVMPSFAMMIITVLSYSKNPRRLYTSMIFIIHILITSFLLSYDIVIKLLLWETLWIPAFILLGISGKNNLAVSFSKQWFISEVLLISSIIMIFKQVGGIFDLQSLIAHGPGIVASNQLAFTLMLIAIFLRFNLFPFNSISKSLIKSTEPEVSMILTVVYPIVPVFFLITFMYPLFRDNFISNSELISYIAMIGMAASLVRLFINKGILPVIYSQLLIFNSLILIWCTRLDVMSVTQVVEFFMIKSMLSLMIIYFGNRIHTHQGSELKFSSWIFSLSLIMSFGIPGIVIARPLFVMLSSWYYVFPTIVILKLVLLSLCFIYISITVSPLLSRRPIETGQPRGFNIAIIAMFILLLGITFVSIKPIWMHNITRTYYEYNERISGR